MSEHEELPADAEEAGGVLFQETPDPEPPTKRTPAQWAKECGHVDPDPKQAKLGLLISADKFRSWIFAAAKAKNGWGASVPEDCLLTREQYEAAVDAAMSVSIGGSARKAA